MQPEGSLVTNLPNIQLFSHNFESSSSLLQLQPNEIPLYEAPFCAMLVSSAQDCHVTTAVAKLYNGVKNNGVKILMKADKVALTWCMNTHCHKTYLIAHSILTPFLVSLVPITFFLMKTGLCFHVEHILFLLCLKRFYDRIQFEV